MFPPVFRHRPARSGPRSPVPVAWHALTPPAGPETRAVDRIAPFMGDFADEDVAWVIRTGELKRVAAGETVIVEGEPLDALFVILQGTFTASSERCGGQVWRLGRGELAGKTAYLHREPAPATLRAEEDGVVLSIPRAALDRKVREDAEFARRFHRVLGESIARGPTWEQGAAGSGYDDLAGLRVHELIERMLRGIFP